MGCTVFCGHKFDIAIERSTIHKASASELLENLRNASVLLNVSTLYLADTL